MTDCILERKDLPGGRRTPATICSGKPLDTSNGSRTDTQQPREGLVNLCDLGVAKSDQA
jgi:hypothetical protein